MATDKEILEILQEAGPRGATWKELQQQIKRHHGVISGMLSTLHTENRVFRIIEMRNNCQIYVHAMYRERFPAKMRIDKVRKTKAHQMLSRIIAAHDAGEYLGDLIREAKKIT